MLRFGVLGAGRIGKVHARTIAASGKAMVAYLADALPKAAEDLAAEVGAKVASVEDIIKAKDVDAILIATPTPFHAEQIEAGSNAGKAVLCEKPVSLSVERIEQCLKTVEKNKTTLMIGFNRRFDPNFAALQKRLRDGAVGNVELATIISRDPA
ncbi:Gfo/Idh/MocA family oxidoreductase, partial [Aestuariivirga sp.]|uniref:Gfo/Idh/MocA family oxidoreductase n=1 Tax=Aestuariivirga sp. TaxID=2650926 RepID=UPI003783D780